MNPQHTREYIRHPTNVPLEVIPQSAKEQLCLGLNNLPLNNISQGGLSFYSPTRIHTNTVVKIKIRAIKPVFKANAVVQWCEKSKDKFELGVQFLDKDDAFKARMVEQVCHIDQYRKETQQLTGRRMTWNKASIEWIEKNGKNFPAY